ncbi:hypothetical protein E4T52_03990 [Aureobasidium sp. EXF-3400]|nr:hypothetical protein E4T52_03990 [Aureobasidium sp. EXF-3400]
MARVRTPSAWESAPDILRTDLPQQTQEAHPHVTSSPPPVSGERRQSRRRISRRGTYPKQRESQWIQYEGGSPQLVPIRNGVPDPPYPVTPPPLERPQLGLPQLGYRAPTPQPALPQSSVQPPVQRPGNKPSRLLQRQRDCARQLDASLSTLSLTALASGSVLLVSAILFVRSVMTGTPHAVVGKSALIVFFALSVAAFIVSFGLILGVLCRRTRATRGAIVRAQARQEIELETRSRASEGGLPLYDLGRRNAICELRDEPGVVVGGRPNVWLQRPDEGRVIHRRFAPPIRVASRHLSEVPFSRPPTPHPRPPLSPLLPPVPSTPPPPIPERNPARLLATAKKIKEDTDADALSTIAQPSPEPAVSPKTLPLKAVTQSDHNGAVSSRSTQMFNQHMLRAGTRELQAYLNAPSNSSLNTFAAYQHSKSDSSTTLDVMSNDRSVYSNVNDQGDDEEHQVGEASVLSLRKVGKARECYIPAPKSNTSMPKSPDTKKQRRSKLRVFTDTSQAQGEKPKARRYQSMMDPLPSAPFLLSAPKNKDKQVAVRRPHSLSPKKLTGNMAKPQATGLGISIGTEQNKENIDPGQGEMETWSALGDR